MNGGHSLRAIGQVIDLPMNECQQDREEKFIPRLLVLGRGTAEVTRRDWRDQGRHGLTRCARRNCESTQLTAGGGPPAAGVSREFQSPKMTKMGSNGLEIFPISAAVYGKDL